MQDGDSYCFQLIEAGVSFPPILVKAEVQFSTPHGTPSSSQTASLRLQAIRFLNGKQEIVQLDLGGANDSDAFVKAVSGKKGLNKHMSMKECCQEVYDRFQAGKFTKDYGHTDSKLKLVFTDMKALIVDFDFLTDVKRSPATPAFVIAFEAACSFGKRMRSAEEASSQASDELKQKERELRQAERKANNLSADLSVEKQRFQRLLSSGGSSMEDALAPRGVGKGGKRSASSFLEGSFMEHDPDSPRKKRKAADAVLVKAGRTAQKEIKTGYIDSSSDEDDVDEPTVRKKGKTADKPSSTEVAESASGIAKDTSKKDKSTSTPKEASKQKAKVVEVPSLNARRSIRSAKAASKSGFVESDEEEEEEADGKSASATPPTTSGKSKSKQSGKKKGVMDSDTEVTVSDSDHGTIKKRKKSK